MLTTSTLLALALAASPATDRYLAAEGIAVTSSTKAPATVDDAAWNTTTATRVPVAAQTAIHLPDKNGTAGLQQPGPGTVVVRAVATKTDLAVLLEWSDASEDRIANETDRFGDAAAIEVPVAFGAGQRLPYVGMGDAGSTVLVHMVRAGDKGAVVARHATAAGFGSLTHAPSVTWMKTAMAYQPKAKTWRAVFVRPLKAADHSVDAGLVPMAFALWDGGRAQRGGTKVLSAWRVLKLPGKTIDPAYVQELSFGYGDGEVGDPTRGKQMVESICVSCHRIGDKAFSPIDVAPELTNVGVYSSYSYLRDSVVNPSAVLVPNLNKNRHQDRSKPRDENGAYPSAGQGTFAVVDGSGKATSIMPAFATMPPAQVADVVAYLKTLGTTPTPSTPTSGAVKP